VVGSALNKAGQVGRVAASASGGCATRTRLEFVGKYLLTSKEHSSFSSHDSNPLTGP
jgi:hypothetical protein